MSLDWSCEQVRDFAALQKDSNEMATTDCLIWGTMITGLPDITEKNIKEWRFRSQVLASVGRELGRQKKEDGTTSRWVPSKAELERRVGLSTNASPKTRAQFMRSVSEWLTRDAEYVLRMQDKNQSATAE